MKPREHTAMRVGSSAGAQCIPVPQCFGLFYKKISQVTGVVAGVWTPLHPDQIRNCFVVWIIHFLSVTVNPINRMLPSEYRNEINYPEPLCLRHRRTNYIFYVGMFTKFCYTNVTIFWHADCSNMECKWYPCTQGTVETPSRCLKFRHYLLSGNESYTWVHTSTRLFRFQSLFICLLILLF